MSRFTVSRSTEVAAPSHRIMPLVEDFRAWRQWSPWEELDPELRRTYEGATSGVGATYAWEGNRKAGAGSMEIVAATPESLRIVLRFLKPWRATNDVVFTFAPQGEGTRVTWTMAGPRTLGLKIMGVFTSMDKLVGKDFEKGLARLKAVAEQPG